MRAARLPHAPSCWRTVACPLSTTWRTSPRGCPLAITSSVYCSSSASSSVPSVRRLVANSLPRTLVCASLLHDCLNMVCCEESSGDASTSMHHVSNNGHPVSALVEHDAMSATCLSTLAGLRSSMSQEIVIARFATLVRLPSILTTLPRPLLFKAKDSVMGGSCLRRHACARQILQVAQRGRAAVRTLDEGNHSSQFVALYFFTSTALRRSSDQLAQG